MRRYRRTLALALIAVGIAGAIGPRLPIATAQSPQSGSTVSAIVPGTSVPNQRRELGFDMRAVIARVEVKKGDQVRTGQLLVKLDEAEVAAQHRARRLQADTELAVQGALAEQDLRQAQHDKTKKNFDQGVATEIELKEASAQLEISKVRVEQARLEREVNTAEADSLQARLDRMSLRSTIDGFVVDVLGKEGEIVEETRHVVEVVSIDPLFIEVNLADFEQVRNLSVGQTLQVRFRGGSWQGARINFISPVGDSRSGTRPFRLEIDNKPDAQGRQRPPGELVEVQLP